MLPPTTKPYLIRALYEWCVDHDFTPHLLVEVNEQCRVPMQYVKDGTIILNIGPSATKNLTLDNDWIQFTARFSGVSQMVAVPVARVGALYTRETQEGMGFEVTEFDESSAEVLSAIEADTAESSDEAPARSDNSRSGNTSTTASDEDKSKQEARARFKLVED